MIVEHEFVIEQPVDAVFSAMADIEQRPRWVAPAQEREKITEGPLGEGTKFRAIDKYPGQRAEFTQEITAYQPNRLLAESWDGPMEGSGETRFFDENGSTRVRLRVEMNPTGLLGLLAPLMKSWAKRAIGKDIERLEELIAADTAGADSSAHRARRRSATQPSTDCGCGVRSLDQGVPCRSRWLACSGTPPARRNEGDRGKADHGYTHCRSTGDGLRRLLHAGI